MQAGHFTGVDATASTRSNHDRPIRSSTPLRHQISPTDLDISLFLDKRLRDLPLSRTSRPFLITAPEDMKSAKARKFSYASVKEETGAYRPCSGSSRMLTNLIGEDTPQSFESSLSSEDLQEVEWIAWGCSAWCQDKGLCSYHVGGSHDEYVRTRLDGYAHSNPRKLEKIFEEIEKRRQNQKRKTSQSPASAKSGRSRTDSGLDVWGERLKKVLTQDADRIDEDAIADESDDELVAGIHQINEHQLAAIERLPGEILDQIFSYVQMDHSADELVRQAVNLAACSLASKSLHTAAIRVMYRHVSIAQSKQFVKVLRSLIEDSTLGGMVHWLDFSHFSNIGFGRTRAVRESTPFVTPSTLKEFLDHAPLLQAFLVHEHIDDELDVSVLSKVFRMPHLQALDFTACSSRAFTESFTTVCTLTPWRDNSMISLGAFTHPLKRLSLHECTTLQEPVFEALLPRLTNLTHLDVAHTLINDDALLSIPASARITHLNLERCTRLTGSAVARFLTSHPAAKDTMVYLNLGADHSRHRLLSAKEVSRILDGLPSTVKSLNLAGAIINPGHVPQLKRLACQLEELGLKAAELGMEADINRIFGLDSNEAKENLTLRYIDLTNVKSVTQMSLSYSPDTLISPRSLPLETIELGSDVLDQLNKRNRHAKNPDWVVRELGRRGWYSRSPAPSANPASKWKMGARWWGMRKIPMVDQEVGGMYGYFMFKRN